jgi:hypothetical protein
MPSHVDGLTVRFGLGPLWITPNFSIMLTSFPLLNGSPSCEELSSRSFWGAVLRRWLGSKYGVLDRLLQLREVLGKIKAHFNERVVSVIFVVAIHVGLGLCAIAKYKPAAVLKGLEHLFAGRVADIDPKH